MIKPPADLASVAARHRASEHQLARQATLDLSRALMHSTQTRAVSEPLGVLQGLFGIEDGELFTTETRV